MSAPLSTAEVRAVWETLVLTGDETVAVHALERLVERSSVRHREQVAVIVDAICRGDRPGEAVAWRQLECDATIGYPSETPIYMWRHHPVTGTRLHRYDILGCPAGNPAGR